MNLFELKSRRRELLVKLQYAFERHAAAMRAFDAEGQNMTAIQAELLGIEMQIQRVNMENTMAASDRAWSLKRIREWTNSL